MQFAPRCTVIPGATTCEGVEGKIGKPYGVALSQVEVFRDIAGVTGLVMTKLDGTARGGILVAIAAKFGLPVHFIGVGESIDDLAPFSARDFARAVAGVE